MVVSAALSARDKKHTILEILIEKKNVSYLITKILLTIKMISKI